MIFPFYSCFWKFSWPNFPPFLVYYIYRLIDSPSSNHHRTSLLDCKFYYYYYYITIPIFAISEKRNTANWGLWENLGEGRWETLLGAPPPVRGWYRRPGTAILWRQRCCLIATHVLPNIPLLVASTPLSTLLPLKATTRFISSIPLHFFSFLCFISKLFNFFSKWSKAVDLFFFLSGWGIIQIVALLLENGADVNSRNYCGQVQDFDFFFCLLSMLSFLI